MPFNRKLIKVTLLGLVIPLISAGSCATVSGSCKALVLKEYDQEFTNEFLKQLDSLSPLSPMAIYVTEANILRNDVRTCQNLR